MCRNSAFPLLISCNLGGIQRGNIIMVDFLAPVKGPQDKDFALTLAILIGNAI
jgi:hypothetical protein